jgi:hypothetical protein
MGATIGKGSRSKVKPPLHMVTNLKSARLLIEYMSSYFPRFSSVSGQNSCIVNYWQRQVQVVQ